MKNSKLLKFSILGLLPVVMAVGVISTNKNNTIKVDAYDKNGVLTKNLNLNDCTDDEIKSYYSSLSGKSASELQGNNLLKNLKTILKDGQKYFKYDGDSLWAMYEITDRDWEKSPASQITGYNPSTNTVSNYTYGSNTTSNKGSNPYIHALYVDRDVDNQTRAWDDHQQSQWGINQEHIWPKSQGFNESGAGGARGDPMHLWAGNGRVNGTEHNNNMYGFVNLDDKDNVPVNPYTAKGFKNLKDNYSGRSLTISTSSDTVFEPQDSDKGDIARSIFYMVARYNNIAGNDTINTNNPNLALKQTTESLASYTTTSNNKLTGYMGVMTDLLYWNHLDPVDEYEIHRNNLLYRNYTNNRNPFIDYPEWADYIWGKPVYNGRSFVSYNSDPTGYVNLTTDTINHFKGDQPQTVSVTSIEIVSKPNKLVYDEGDDLDTTGLRVKAYFSNNETRVLNENEYTVTPKTNLKATDKEVTVTYQDKSKSFAIAVKSQQSTTGETFSCEFAFNSNPGGWPTENSTTLKNYTYSLKDVDYSFGLKNVKCNSGYLMLSQPAYLGLPAINGWKLTKVVAKNSGSCSTSVNVGISSSSSSGEYISGGASQTWSNTNTAYTYNLTGTSDNTVYYLYVTNKNAQIVSLELTYESCGASGSIDVDSISLNKNALSLELGATEMLEATVSPENATVQLVSWESSDNSVAIVNDDGEVTAVAPGSAIITCKSLDDSTKTSTCSVTVNAPVTLSSLELSGEYATEFYVGDQFTSDGLIVTAKYSDNSTLDVSDDVEISGFDLSAIGQQTITVSYGGIDAFYTINVKEKGLADNETIIVASQQGLVSKDPLASYQDEKSIVTVSFNKVNGTQPVYYSSTSSFRIYQKNSFTLTSLKTMTKIEFEMSDSNTAATAFVSTVGLTDNIWEGSTQLITFNMKENTSQRNIVSIKITYDINSESTPLLTGITLGGDYKTEFIRNDTFSYDGLIVNAHYSDGSSKEVTPTSISEPNMTTSGSKTITVSYTENGITETETYTIEVSPIVTVSVTLSGSYRTEFFQGEDFDPSGMRIIEHYNNGETSAQHLPTSQGCEITGYDMNTPGNQTVTVSWNGVSTTYTINVIARPSAKVSNKVTGYFLVNDVSELKANDTILIVGSKKNDTTGTKDYHSLAPYVSGNNCKTNSVPTPVNDYFASDVASLTLGGSSGAWTLYDGKNYLYAAGESSDNHLKGTNNADNANAKWNISINNGLATIKTTDTTVLKNTIRFNTSHTLFSCYSSGQNDIQIFKYQTKNVVTEYTASIALSKAIKSAQDILDSECQTKNVTLKNWNKIANLISDFLLDASSDDYKILMYGEAKSSELGGNMIEDFLARYDLIVSEYGYSKFIVDFNNKTTREFKLNNLISSPFNNIFASLSQDNIILIIAALSAVFATAMYIAYRKKRVGGD